MSISELIRKRKSCRAFSDRSLDLKTVEKLLEIAKWAPSGVNHQPAKVALLGPKTRNLLSEALIEQFDAGIAPNPDYSFCPGSWPDAYKARRKACGSSLYRSLRIGLDDVEGRKNHRRRNFRFFDASAALIIFVDHDMPKGSWLDVGLFIQNLLLAAEGLGLASCAMATLAEYPDTVRSILSLAGVDIVCGIALGYEDPDHPLNSYRTEREPLENFTSWYV